MNFPEKVGPDLTRRVPPQGEATGDADATIREFCAELRCAPATAWRMINTGQVDAYHVGRRVKITRASIDALKERNRIHPKDAPDNDAA